MGAPRLDTHDARNRSQSRGRPTSLGGGKVRQGHKLHGMAGKNDKKKNSSSSSSKSGGTRSGRSKSRDRRPRRHEYDTPFDDKGRCHYHKNVQLASKKFNGGWKVLSAACPKCMEEKLGSDDDKSVTSVRSAKSTTSTDAHGQFDKNGCCVLHSHIQVAKKRVLGGGWKVVRICPSCNGGQSIDLDDDAISVRSGKSTRSTSSRKSSSGTGTQRCGTSGKASQSGRYGELPFDADGYCCRHPSVQIAQKKMIGGFKIIHDVCPDCAQEGSASRTGGRGRSRSKSRDSGRRSRSRPRQRAEGRDDASRSQASSKKKKRIRVKNLKTDDGNGRVGKYTGYVNDDHIPNGEGFITYDDGKVWEGEWAEGCRVNGKMRSSR